MEDFDALKAFDSTYTTRQTSLMKVMLLLLPAADRQLFAGYIRLQEAMEIITRKQAFASPLKVAEADSDIKSTSNTAFIDADILAILKQMLPFCEPSDKELLQQLLTAFEQFSEIQEMMKMAEMMKDMFPEGDEAGEMNLDSILAMFQGLDPSAMSDLYQNGGKDAT